MRVVQLGIYSVLDHVEQLNVCIQQTRYVQTWHNEILISSITRYDDKYKPITVRIITFITLQ